jgi:hypothetical protein
MSRQSSRQDRPKAAPVADIYVGLLFVSVSAIIGGIVFLVLELNKYGWQVAT